MTGKIGRSLRRWERSVLQHLYGFDSWHVGHADEPYVADIVRHLNAWPEGRREAVAEIGCGLGDIIRRLHFRQRVGLDRDPRALLAAQLLARLRLGAQPRFEVFDFPKAQLVGVYNAIIMVNWIHQIDTHVVQQAVHAYFADHLRHGGCVVLDTVDDRAYMYNHDVRALAPSGAVIDHLGQYARGRHVWVVR